MKRLLAPLFLAFLFPLCAFAQSFPAGFPEGALWLSKARPVAGDEVQVYVPLFNSGDTTLTGTLVFLVDETAIASKQISLGAGEAKIESTTWQTKVGTYSLSAKIENSEGGGAALQIAKKVTSPITVSVAKPPEPSVIAQSISSAANIASQAVSAAAPSVLGAATTFYEKAEDVRGAGVARLEEYLAQAEDPQKTSSTNSESSQASSVSGFEAPEKKSIVSQVSKAAAQIALVVMKIKFLFYPLLLLLILFIISMLFKWASRRPV